MARDPWDRVSLATTFAGGALVILAALSWRRWPGQKVLGLEPMALFSIGVYVVLPSAILDLRRVRSMDWRTRVYNVGAVLLAVAVALYWVQRLAG